MCLPPVLSVLSRLTCPGLSVSPTCPDLLLRLSCPGCPVMAVLQQLSCLGRPILSCSGRPEVSFLPRLSPLGCFVLIALSWLSYPAVLSSCLVLVFMFLLSGPDCPVYLSCPRSSVSDALLWLPCLWCHVPAILSSLFGPGSCQTNLPRLTCLGCHVTAVLPRMSRPGCPVLIVLYGLSCPACPVPVVPSQLS
jgi:hypothetical protein